jgi:hypothetical protein
VSSEPFRKIFPLQIGTQGWAANSNLIEFVGHQGSFRNTTVDGQITGFSLDLGIIDDPFKGRADADSEVIRDKTWLWFTDDFLTRLSKDAGLLIIMSRQHLDDLLGRLLAQSGHQVRVLRYLALAEADEDHWMSEWQLTTRGWVHVWKHIRRSKGEALFPEHKPMSFLLQQRKRLSQASWESLYQQNPIVAGGGQLPIEHLKVLHFFDRADSLSSVRYWDKGASDAENAAYTARVLMHKMKNGTFVIEHVVRGRWNALEREQHIKTYSKADKILCKNYSIVVEPGAGLCRQRERGKHDAQSSRLPRPSGRGHWLETGARRTFRRAGASGQCVLTGWLLAPGVPRRMRNLAERQIQRPGRRGSRRLQQADQTIFV